MAIILDKMNKVWYNNSNIMLMEHQRKPLLFLFTCVTVFMASLESGMKELKEIFSFLANYLSKEEKPVRKDVVNKNIWKAEDGTWQFVGIFSNNYLDKDRKLNILSADSHRGFEKSLDDGIVTMPVLRYWHIPVDIGVAKHVAFDERGFMIVQGEFYREFSPLAEALGEWEHPLGMSHRMLPQHITTDPNDKNVITSYVAEEVSFLPVEKAANPLTFFGVQETEQMLDIKAEKESTLRAIIGDERLDQLDLMVSRLKEAGDAYGLPQKEADETTIADELIGEVEGDVAAETTEEAEVAEEVATEETVVEDQEAVKEEEEVVVAEEAEEIVEAEEVAGEPTHVDEPVAEVADDAALTFVTSEQLVDVIKFVKEAFEEIGVAIGEIRQATEKAVKIAEHGNKVAVEKAQDDILQSSLASMLGAAQSVIGRNSAVVKEGDELSDAAPAAVSARSSLPFIDAAIFNILEAK